MNLRFPFSRINLCGVIVLLALLFCTSARAENLKAELTLSETTTVLGAPVELELKITGVAQASVPRAIAVDGLSINYSTHSSQQSTQFSFGTGGSGKKDTTNMTVIYMVAPQREGTFAIPPITVEAGGKKLTTNAVTLTVKADTAGRGLKKADTEVESILAELVPASTQAYVGEAVPLELRVYVDSRIHWQANEPPSIKGDGFTIQKFVASPPTSVTKNGRSCDLVVFRTAITPVKAGRIAIGPGEFNILAQLPQKKNKRPHMTGGLFDDDFFNDPFGMFAAPQKIAIRAIPVELETRPLPTAGQPKNFSGAVGRFTFLSDASPRSVHLGDPITLTMKISGRGNFDRITPPRLADESGWRTYPASGKYAADDEIGISGTKTFEMAVVPEEKKSALPAVEFSYFDPVTEKYVTLKSEPVAIAVSGEKAAPTPAPNKQEAPAGTIPEKQAATANDILYLRTDAPRWGASFEPLHRTRRFWLLQTVPLLLLLGLACFQWKKRRTQDEDARRIAELRRQKTAAAKILQSSGSDDETFLEAAVKCLRIETAISTGKNHASIDADDVCASRAIDAETAGRIHSVFAGCGELRYAGVAGAGNFQGINRTEVLDAIRNFERSEPHV